MEEMEKPYLIQRMKARNQSKADELPGIDSIFSMDYMGSSEFEWGALPESLKRVCKNIKAYEIVVINDVKDYRGFPLCLVCTKERAAVYEAILREWAKAANEYKFGLKETISFTNAISGKSFDGKPIKDSYNKIDAWWDILNDVFFTFGVMSEVLLQALRNVQAKKKAAGDKGWYTEDN
jgi:hypothetical protein